MVNHIIKDIQMKPLDTPKIYYVSRPHYNEGLTAITPIQTSHIAFHFWSNPDRKILHHPESKCLLEFDLYTCGTLTRRHIQRVLRHLTQFEPTHMNLTLLNRNLSLTIDQQVTWDKMDKGWVEWIQQFTKGTN
jgi:S-adenosylmethionine/arginine decarboxylase-like enzyme